MSKPEGGPDEEETRPAPDECSRAGISIRILAAPCLFLLLLLGACDPGAGGAGAPGGPGQAAQATVGDADDGRLVFNRICGTCHDAVMGGPNKIGPNLFAVVGRKAATVPGYAYSDAMTMANLTWDQATLNEFIGAPEKKLPGTKMAYVGLTDRIDKADVLAYLETLK